MTSFRVFLIALTAGAVLTWMVRGLALRFGAVAKPNGIVATHVRPIPHLGGVGIAVAAALVFWYTRDSVGILANGLVAGGLAFLCVGIIDDVRALPPGTKFVLQIAAAAVAVMAGFRAFPLAHPALAIAATMVWLVVIVNAVNMTDVCDGLVAGIVATALLAIGIARPDLRMVALVVAGATCGFLVLNAPPASIFLGDAGSHLLGFLLAALAVMATGDTSKPLAPVSMLLLIGVPLFELAFLCVMRLQKGIRPWRGSPDHFALRLQAAGLSKLQTDLIAWLACALLAMTAFGLLRLPNSTALIVIGVIVFAAVAIASGLRAFEAMPATSKNSG